MSPILLALLPLLSAQNWTQQGPLPTGLDLHDVCLISPTEIWAAAEAAQVLHSTDGGMSWSTQELPGVFGLWAIDFTDPLNGWVAGDGRIFWTANGGATWQASPGTTGSVYELSFLTPQFGWAAGNGGIVYRTSDGGRNWGWSALPDASTIRAVHFTDVNRGWAGNLAGQIYRSLDGGVTWTLQHQGAASSFGTIWFADANEGWALGASTILHTQDSGANWTPLPPPAAGARLNDVYFLDRDHAWGAGARSEIVVTANGWQSSSVQKPHERDHMLEAVAFADANTGYAVGEQGRIYSTGDGGAHWVARSSGAMNAYTLDFADAQHGWASLDRGMVARTTNGGAQWTNVEVQGFNRYGYVAALGFADRQRGWATGTFTDVGMIAGTTDGGLTWNVQYERPFVFLQCLAAADAQTAVAAGNFGNGVPLLVRTANGGQSWQEINTNLGLNRDIDFADPLNGWIVGGGISKTSDAGLTWTLQTGSQYALEAVDMLDTQIGWAVGYFGEVRRTINGGVTWTSVGGGSVLGTVNLLGVSALDADHAWVTGYGRFVARTANGGATWTKEVIPDSGYASFTDAKFFSWDSGFICGDPRVDDGGVWRRRPDLMPSLELQMPRLQRGAQASFDVTGALPAERVHFVLSTAGLGTGPCRGATCLDILAPIRSLGSAVADGLGTARRTLTVPMNAPFISVAVQAVVLRGPGGSMSELTTPAVSPIEP